LTLISSILVASQLLEGVDYQINLL
jgi:hypothetical protein